MIILAIIFIIFFLATFIVSHFAGAVPFLGSLVIPLIIICVGLGVALFVAIIIKLYKELGHKK